MFTTVSTSTDLSAVMVLADAALHKAEAVEAMLKRDYALLSVISGSPRFASVEVDAGVIRAISSNISRIQSTIRALVSAMVPLRNMSENLATSIGRATKATAKKIADIGKRALNSEVAKKAIAAARKAGKAVVAALRRKQDAIRKKLRNLAQKHSNFSEELRKLREQGKAATKGAKDKLSSRLKPLHKNLTETKELAKKARDAGNIKVADKLEKRMEGTRKQIKEIMEKRKKAILPTGTSKISDRAALHSKIKHNLKHTKRSDRETAIRGLHKMSRKNLRKLGK